MSTLEKATSFIALFEQIASAPDYLRRLRGDRSQNEIAILADVSQTYISKVEAGYTNGISYYALKRILDVYKSLEATNV